MRNHLVLSLLSTALLSVGAANALAANTFYYDPANDGTGGSTWKPVGVHAPDVTELPATTGHELNRTIGCPGKGLLDKGCGIEDSDKDKVEDWTDKCPGTPAGMTVNALGCEIDTDGDGLLDSADKCPTVYAKTADGCPVPEVVTKEVIKEVPAAAAAAPGVVETLGTEFFDFDSAKLRPSANEKIEKATNHVVKMEGETYELRGYTDSVGSDAYNQKLSQRRADAVRNAMIKAGAPADRLVAKGYGEANPVGDNATKEGRAQNRRVELYGRK